MVRTAFNHLICDANDTRTAQYPRDIYYGVGLSSGWRRFTRNLLVDLQKGVAATARLPRYLKKVGVRWFG